MHAKSDVINVKNFIFSWTWRKDNNAPLNKDLIIYF